MATALTFLQLAQELREEVGGTGNTASPSAVTNQVGELRRIVNWIAKSDEEIQRKHNEWKFMVGEFSLNTVAGDNSYASTDFLTPVTNLRGFKRDTLKIYLLATGTTDECKLHYIPYQHWYDTYNVGSLANDRPRFWTIGNDLSLKIGPTPNAVYHISGEYQKSVTTMTNNGDSPLYPAEFHRLAVYLGMMKYGRFTGAIEVYQDGERMAGVMMREMERTQLPEVLRAGPLA